MTAPAGDRAPGGSPLGTPLPIDAVLPELHAALDRVGTAVLQAPPGAGKTTRTPLALLDRPWTLGRTILVLEPRRVAARAAARRMAAMLGEEVGGRVGYRIRQDRVTGPRTRIEVVTEGVLIRLLQADPSLEGVGAVIFDEWHERSTTTDLGLALVLDSRGALRPDLRVLVMSATLDTGSVATLLGGAPVVTALVRPHPVETVWGRRPAGRLEAAVATAVRGALDARSGDVLVFLPGAGEIRAVDRLLREGRPDLAAAGVEIVALHGGLPGRDQDAALRPATAGRRVVLATAIAETSVTVAGVRVVVDSGLMRVPRFDPASGMARLLTLPVSRATADQRQGRAAREGPGTCYRLWSAADHAGFPAATTPEILVTDLAPLALDLAEWGAGDPGELRWVDPPPAGPLEAARGLLVELGALDGHGRITRHGRDIAGLGVHPRLGHLLAEARQGLPASALLACQVAAVLGDGDPLRSGPPGARHVDLSTRIEALRRGRAPQHAETARRLARRLGVGLAVGPDAGPVVAEDVGRLVALAYPDRVGRRRPGQTGHWLLRNGRGAWVADSDPMATAEWVVAADLDGDRRDARIWLGAPLHPDDVEGLFGAEMTVHDVASWDRQRGDVVTQRQRRLGAITVSHQPLRQLPAELAVAGLLDGVRTSGVGLLPWTPDLEQVKARVAFARALEGDRWPDLGDAALLGDLGTWLAPWLTPLVTDGRPLKRADLGRLPLADALWGRIGWGRRPELDALAPTHLVVPSGRRCPLRYPAGGAPTVEVRVQELFGSTDTPRIAGGRVAVLLTLTSPAGRPVAVTADLASFWADGYRQVRGELRARYPRHPWPDDPLTAPPTTRAAPRR